MKKEQIIKCFRESNMICEFIDSKIAAPKNAKRLNKQTPCAITGKSIACKSSECLCNAEVLIRHQSIKDRIHIFILKGNYGY